MNNETAFKNTYPGLSRFTFSSAIRLIMVLKLMEKYGI